MFSLGSVPFSSASEWNQIVAPDATYTKLNWPKSTGYNYTVNWDQYSPAVYVASPTDPIVQVRVPDSWGHPGGTISIRMPRDAEGAVGTDGELLIIDGDIVYNFWQFDRTGATTATASSYGFTNVVTGTGWGSQSPFLGAGTTAIGSSQLSGLLVEAETDKGEINHALQLVVDYALVKPGFGGDAISGDGGNPNGIVREGDHLGIPPGTPMPAGLSELGQKVFRALQNYGAYVVDVSGGSTVLRAQANAYDDDTMGALWYDLGTVLPMLQHVTGGTVPGETPPPPTQAPTAAILSTIVASGAGISEGSGTVSSGTVQLRLDFNNAVNVSGTPTLTLNDGGVARYVSGAGTKSLVFSYQVAAGRNSSDLAVSTFNLNGVTDLSGRSVNLSGAPTNPAGTLVIDTKAPTLASIVASGTGITNGSGTLRSGTVRLSLAFDEVVNVSGTPSLTLNNGGTARYVSGNGGRTLTFDYQIAAGQNTSDLAVSAFNLSGVRDRAGNALNLSGAPTNPAGTLRIDTTAVSTPPTPAPAATTLSTIVASGAGISGGSGTVGSGTVQLRLDFNNAVNVTGTPTLALNDGGVARYVSGAGTKSLVFSYEVAAGRNTADLAVSTFNLSGVRDQSGRAVSLTGAPTNPAGTLVIDTKAPTLASIVASGTGITNGAGTLRSGTVRFSLAFDEVVNVSGTPSLTLNNGGSARYVSGSGTGALTFEYQVATGQNTSDLAVSAFNLSGVRDRAGNALNLSSAPRNPAGTLRIDTSPATTTPQRDRIAPTVEDMSVSRRDSRSGTITLNMSENVVVRGTPVLMLNDGSRAVYRSGSGSDTLVFSYNSYDGPRRSEPSVSRVGLSSSSSIADRAGNAADMSGVVASSGGRQARTTSEATSRDAVTSNFAPESVTTKAFDFGDMATNFRTSLAFKPDDHGARGGWGHGHNTAALQLFGQYIASSFVTSGTAAGGTTVNDPNASGLLPTITRSS